MHAHLYTLARALHLAHTLNIHTDTCGRQSRAQSHSQRGRPAPFPAGARTPRPGWASESSNEPARANLPAVPLPETHQHARTYVQPCMHTHMNTRRTLRASALSWVHAQRLRGDVCGDGRHRRHTVAAACGAGAAGDPGGSASCHGIRTWCAAACCFLLGDSRCAWAPARLRGDGDCADGQGAGEEAPHQRAGALCSCVRVVGRLPARASAHAGRAVGATGLSSRSGSRRCWCNPSELLARRWSRLRSGIMASDDAGRRRFRSALILPPAAHLQTTDPSRCNRYTAESAVVRRGGNRSVCRRVAARRICPHVEERSSRRAAAVLARCVCGPVRCCCSGAARLWIAVWHPACQLCSCAVPGGLTHPPVRWPRGLGVTRSQAQHARVHIAAHTLAHVRIVADACARALAGAGTRIGVDGAQGLAEALRVTTAVTSIFGDHACRAGQAPTRVSRLSILV